MAMSDARASAAPALAGGVVLKTELQGSGLFDKWIGRKRNVDGGVPAGRFRERETFRGAAMEETSAVLRFKVFYIGRSRKRSDV